jgi:hypothetical protein
MSQTSYAPLTPREETTSTMKALVFYGPGQIGLETVPIPKPRAGETVIRVTLTTIRRHNRIRSWRPRVGGRDYTMRTV